MSQGIFIAETWYIKDNYSVKFVLCITFYSVLFYSIFIACSH
jgi:hypothetical protein